MRNIPVLKIDIPFCRYVQAAYHVYACAFPGAAWPHYCHEFAPFYLQIQPAHRRHLYFPHMVYLPHVLQPDDCAVLFHNLLRPSMALRSMRFISFLFCFTFPSLNNPNTVFLNSTSSGLISLKGSSPLFRFSNNSSKNPMSLLERQRNVLNPSLTLLRSSSS